MERITVAPGDPRNNAPEWMCITNQRINTVNGETHTKRSAKELVELHTRKLQLVSAGYVTTTQAAKLSGYCARKMRSFATSGEIETLRVEGYHWISQETVAMLKERKKAYNLVQMRKAVS